MTHDLFKALAAGAVLVVLTIRFAARLRGLEPEARTLEIRKGLTGSLLAVAAVAGLFVYLLFTRG